jgi:hypothetical protein
LGIIAGVVMFLLGVAWLNRRAARARAAGEGYGQHLDSSPKRDVVMREHSQTTGFDISELPERPPAEENLPPFALALLPIIIVIALNLAFIELVVR